MSKNVAANREAKEKQGKAIWDDVSTDVFIQVSVIETLKGNRPNGHLSKTGWTNVIEAFKEKTGRSYNYSQMKNKWSSLKKDWQIWTDLVGNKTGLGWDPLRQTIDAPVEWWDESLKEKPEAAKFRAKGLQNVEQLDILFKDIAVTGDGAWAPSQGFVPQNIEGGSSRNEDNDEDTGWDTEFNYPEFNTVQNVTNDSEFSIHTAKGDTQGKEKKRKVERSRASVSSKLFSQLDQVCSSIDSRRRDLPGCSIHEVVKVLQGLPGIVKGDELFLKSVRAFTKRENREAFNALDEPDVQVAWLKLMTS